MLIVGTQVQVLLVIYCKYIKHLFGVLGYKSTKLKKYIIGEKPKDGSIKMILGFDWSMGYKEGYILCHCGPFALTGFKV